jgi:hypothetical protein
MERYGHDRDSISWWWVYLPKAATGYGRMNPLLMPSNNNSGLSSQFRRNVGESRWILLFV